MKITQESTQENLKLVVSIPSLTPSIYQALMNSDTYLNTSRSIKIRRFWTTKSVYGPWWQGLSRVSWSSFPKHINSIFYYCYHSCKDIQGPRETHIEIHASQELLWLLVHLRVLYQATFRSTSMDWRTLHQTTTIKLLCC